MQDRKDPTEAKGIFYAKKEGPDQPVLLAHIFRKH